MRTALAGRRRAPGWAPATLALAVLALAVSPAPAASPTAVIAATLTPAELTIGASASIAGNVTESGIGVTGAPLALQVDGYPFGEYVTVARQSSGVSGGFAFTALKPDRNTRLRVVLESAPSVSAQLQATVDPRVALNARSLGPGRTRLSIRVQHTVHAGSASTSVSWFLAARGTRVFRLAAVTPTREAAPGVSYASATVDPPATRFAYRACLNPGWEHAMGMRAAHGRCPRHDYAVTRDVR